MGFRPPRRFGIDEDGLVRLTAQVEDPAYWAALTLLSQTADRLSRRDFIKAVGANPPPNQPQHRAARLQFLLHFLADTSLVYLRDPNESRVCDVAADRLAVMLGLRASRRGGYGVPTLPHDPLASLFLRATVAKAATEELTRLKK